jgi:hypothetical protein
MSKKSIFFIAITVVTLSSIALAQIPAVPSRPDAAANAAAAAAQKVAANAAIGPSYTSDCAYTFTSLGTATTKFYMQYCVTVNGNITEFQSPAGVEYLRVGTYGEGYGICDLGYGGKYWDYADYGDSGNWLAPVLVSLTATTAKISRTTADGIWTLTQTFTQDATNAKAMVTMALKNNSAVNRFVYFYRWADVDANSILLNNMDGTTDSAWGYDVSLGYGLILRRAAPNAYSHNGWARNLPWGPDPCNLDPNYVGTLTATDGSIVLSHEMYVNKGKTATVKLSYSAF